MKKPQSNLRVTDIRIRDLRAFPACWIPYELFELGCSWRAIATYTGLAYYASGATSCDVSIKRIAASVGVSEDTVKRGLKELKEKQAILVQENFRPATTHRPQGSREQLPNEYFLLELGKRKTPI